MGLPSGRKVPLLPALRTREPRILPWRQRKGRGPLHWILGHPAQGLGVRKALVVRRRYDKNITVGILGEHSKAEFRARRLQRGCVGAMFDGEANGRIELGIGGASSFWGKKEGREGSGVGGQKGTIYLSIQLGAIVWDRYRDTGRGGRGFNRINLRGVPLFSK